MDTLSSTIIYLLIGLVGFVVIGYIGFRVPAPILPPKDVMESQVERKPLPEGLPDLAYRFFSNGSGYQANQAQTLAAWGRGYISSRLRFFGKFWLPVSWQLYLVPGSEIVFQYRITWFRRRFIRGGEEYRQGKGRFLLGSEQVENQHLDDTERILPWIFALWLSPASLVNNPALDWIQSGEDKITLRGKGDLQKSSEFLLTVDPSTGVLSQIQTLRRGSRSGDDYPFLVDLRSPQRMDAQILQSNYTATWDNDVYLKLKLAGICYNYDLQTVMQQGVEGLSA
jgi:hypothetical protein